MKKKLFIFAAAVLLGAPMVFGQADDEKMFRQTLDKEVERYTNILKLDDLQVYLTDSTLTYNMTQMRAEMERMSKDRVSNTDIYYMVQDKWYEKNDEAFHKFLSEEQWHRYLKSGAEKEMKARERRRAKREKK